MIIRVRRRHAAAVLCALLWSASAWAQEPQAPPTEPIPVLPPIRVTAPPPVSSSSEQIIPGRDFELRPQGRPADILRLVPGLIINQHQGGGKAEQYLIRGFDADHGTDLAIAVEGYRSDGPFEHPNGYVRFNIFAKATASLAQDMTLSVWASHYRAEWHGSGQLPSRAIRAGLIDRFGAIDPSEGGVTQRTNLN